MTRKEWLNRLSQQPSTNRRHNSVLLIGVEGGGGADIAVAQVAGGGENSSRLFGG